MKIEMARHSGFCMGVRNAVLKIVDELNSSDENIFVYGPLIHNPQSVEVLKKRGLITINSLNEIKDKQIAIRTHGIPVSESREIRKKATRTINLTCSRVARVQAIIKKYSRDGYFTIIVGDKDHAEVIGLKSYAGAGVFVVSHKDDIDLIPLSEKYIVVSQTTHERAQFEDIVNAIKKSFSNVNVIDTICDSTRLRQDDVIEAIKKGIDTLVVVGGKNSANTSRLAKIGIDNGIKTFHIETDDELKTDDFKNSNYVLVTAGASTPGWIINNVLEKLYTIKYSKSNVFTKVLKMYFEFLVRSNIISSIAAFIMVLIAQKFAGLQVEYKSGIIASLYIFIMYSVNNYFDRHFLIKSNSYKYGVYKKFGLLLLSLSIPAFFISLYLACTLSPLLMYTILFPYFFGLIYSAPFSKSIIKKINWKVFKKIYSSKVITSFGWLVGVIYVPYFMQDVAVLKYAALALFFCLFIFLRNTIIDLVAFQGDLILGRDTLATWLGIKKTSVFVTAATVFTAVFFTMVVVYFGQIGFLALLLAIGYYLLIFYKIIKTDYFISLKYEFIIEANYLILLILYFIL
ncbi:MAG: 4-hydroxy-3-methylbut-2-enyl diphosphate reductase [Spirochaetota bacterium]